MTTHILENKADVARLFTLLNNRDLPMTVNIRKGKDRSIQQNRTQRMWMNEAAEQGDQTAEEYRGYSKLHFGVPILRNENEEFKAAYDEVIRPLPYELKLKAMMIPLDFPVTRLMGTGQCKRYLDDIYSHFTGLGMRLTEPDEDEKWGAIEQQRGDDD